MWTTDQRRLWNCNECRTEVLSWLMGAAQMPSNTEVHDLRAPASMRLSATCATRSSRSRPSKRLRTRDRYVEVTMTTTDWNELFHALKQAKDELESAEIALSHARSVETMARNEVNRAQGAINKAIAEEKEKAPRDSDWFRDAHPPRMYPAG